jgi:hypothetical protein
VSASFARWIAESAPGDTLNMKVKRGNKSISLNVKLGAIPKKKETEKEE